MMLGKMKCQGDLKYTGILKSFEKSFLYLISSSFVIYFEIYSIGHKNTGYYHS